MFLDCYCLAVDLASSPRVKERFLITHLLALSPIQTREESSAYEGKPGLKFAPGSSLLRCSWRFHGTDQWETSDFLWILTGIVKCSKLTSKFPAI